MIFSGLGKIGAFVIFVCFAVEWKLISMSWQLKFLHLAPDRAHPTCAAFIMIDLAKGESRVSTSRLTIMLTLVLALAGIPNRPSC